MDLYKELNLTPVRSGPNVWVNRMVIFEALSPDTVIIRDIALTRGLNIVWAEETDDDDPAAEISGHSAGKTTFCRFLRYVLGEKTFGTKANMELIRKALPEGYVAAEIHVAGKKWAVRRPFGSGRMSYIKQDASVEDLLQQHTGAVSQDEYPKKLGLEALLDEMETGAIVRTRENIEWGHILAWCTRDQETRFQNIHDWRSPRSESEAPTFRFSKGGPLFVMRAVLGLFLPDELKGEETLAELRREKERIEKELEEKRREPQFRVNQYDHDLRRRLTTLLPNARGIDTMPLHSGDLLPDLHRLTETIISEIERAIHTHESEHADLQNQIDEVGGQIRQREDNLQQLDALFDLNAAADKELDEGLSRRQSQRQQLREFQDKMCPFGDVLFRECSYVVDRQGKLRITQLQDAHAMKQAEAKRTEEKQRIEGVKSDLLTTVELLQNRRRNLQARRDSLGTKYRKKRQELHDLKQAREALETWTQRRNQGIGYEELACLRQKLDDTSSRIEKLEKDLIGLLRQHDSNREWLASIFSGAVRAVLRSGSYDGEVSLDNRELTFRITHGPAMSGEAVETLSVLLSDVAALVYNTVSNRAHLPGFILHDSPREADLEGRIYRSFIRFMASLQIHFGGADACPFQYIVTTTTPPPDELQTAEFIKIHLNAAKPQELLLRRNVATASPQAGPQLFPGGSPG